MLHSPTLGPRRREAAITILSSIFALSSFARTSSAASPQSGQVVEPLKRLSLEALGNIEVTTTSKEPETLRRTAAAVYVLTNEDIRRSGATSLPEVLRLVPGLQVARMDSDHWAVGVRGFANQFSQSLLVLIDGRSVYTPLFAGVYWSIEDTLFEDIERIEIVRGTWRDYLGCERGDRTHLLGPQVGESRNTFDVDFIHQVGPKTDHDLGALGAREPERHHSNDSHPRRDAA